jgi:hypothetical protein
MTALSPSTHLDLPPDLREPLQRVARRQSAVAAGSASIAVVTIALGVLLGSSLILGYLALAWYARLPIATIAWGIFLYSAFRILRPAIRRWSLSGAARQVEHAVPGLQERMSSAVELLTQESQAAFRGSPQLVAHLVDQAREHAGAINPKNIVAADPVVRRGAMLIPIFIAWMVLTINPHTSRPLLRGAYATLFPWERHVPRVLATIGVTPGDVVLTQGDSLEIRAAVTDAGRDNSGEASLVQRFADGQTISQPMLADEPAAFHLKFNGVSQGFSYCVRTPGGESDRFTVAVLQRPVITRLDIHYDYPPYSGIPASDTPASDGTIQALVGTRVTLAIQCGDSLQLDKCNILLNEEGHDAQVVELSAADAGVYRAIFPIRSSGEYRIRLLNARGLSNRDDQPRPIVAKFDQPPAVTITSPVGQVTVRPDDVVPIEFSATDDFGIASMNASVSVDDRPPRRILLPLAAGDKRNISSTWTIDLQEILKQAGAANASRITYQLKAIDNRDPDPQTGLSATQTLLLSAGALSYSEQINAQRKRQFEEVIRTAIDQLQQAEWRSRNLKEPDDRHVLNPDELRNARELRELLVNTSGELSAAAQQFLTTPYAHAARQAQQIAEHPIADAAADIAQAEFNADQPTKRRQYAATANQHVVAARKDLEKLLPSLEQTLRKNQAMDSLRQAQRKQREAAEEMASHPQNADANRRLQQQAIDRLNDAVNRDPALNEGNARELARELTDLAQRVEGEQSRQDALHGDTAKQLDGAQALDAGQLSKDAQAKTKAAVEKLSRQQDELARQTDALRQSAQHLTNRAKDMHSAVVAKRADEAQAALDRAQQSQHRAADAAAQHKADEAANEQTKAQEDLARAQQALRDTAANEQPGDADAQSGEAGAQKEGNQNASQSGSSSQSPENAGDAQQASREAAQAAQEAQAAQRQALAPNPAAAAQAAAALARATAAAARASRSDSSQSSGQQSPTGQSADAGASRNSQNSDATPGHGANSSSGIQSQNSGGRNTPPAAVLDLGVSPADWARLPPQMQQELLSASQQSAPPAYREMVRDYYTKIAKMQTDRRPQ